MPEPKFPLMPQGHSELKRPFPLVQDLFTFAEKHKINTEGFDAQNTGYPVKPLPSKFFPLVESFPGAYFVTAYEDRRDHYYREDTRHQLVRLSTAEHKASTDDRVREMDIKMKSGARADRIEVRARELIKEHSFQNINQATGKEIEQPHGEARYTYDIDADGKQYPKEFKFNRLDEGLFAFGDTQKPVRWLRNLVTEKIDGAPDQMTYEDRYIIREGDDAWKAKRADAKTTITGTLEQPQSILVEIGFGPQSTAETLYQSKDEKTRLLFHAPFSKDDHPLDTLQSDPLYAELLKESPNEETFLDLLQSRITMLQEDWDKPQSVYDDATPRIEQREQSPLASYPAGELLLLPDTTHAIWPKTIAENPEFLLQQSLRNIARHHLDAILSHLPHPNTSFDDALTQELITEDQVADLFISLRELLKEGSEYQRILLYLPFEFLLSSSTSFTTDRLRTEAPRFQKTYMDAWWRLLNVHDVRANFVDGDVLEVEKRTGDLPRVVKVVHFIPTLIQKGWLTTSDVTALLEDNDDPTLIQSITDVFPSSSASSSLQEASIEEEQSSTMTKKREAWLKKEEERKTLLLASKATADAIIARTISKNDAALYASPETLLFIQQAFIAGLRIAIERLARDDEAKAQTLFNDFSSSLISLWRHNTPSLHDELSKTFFHLHHLHLINDNELKNLGLSVPAIAGPFSSNLPRMENEMHDIESFTHLIEANPFLSSHIFPAMLVFGSRLKGYGSPTADLDVAVFIKPGVPFDEKEAIRTALKTIITHDRIEGNAVEFWLEESEDTLRIRSPKTFDATIGESSWTHILFGAAWAGNEKTIEELRAKLLTPYFFNNTPRRTFLEEMERDVLQYRLLHKGYEKFFPVTTTDVFFDPGYRQTATKLFLSNVFLPKLSV